MGRSLGRPAPYRLPASIRVFRVPNPFFESANNVYLILGRRPTLIDTGLRAPAAAHVIETELKKLALTPGDLHMIVLTHKHPDHFGLAHTLQKASGAAVLVHADDWLGVSQFHERRGEFLAHLRRTLTRCAVPGDRLDELETLMRGFSDVAESVEAEPIADGTRLSLGDGVLQVLHTPGHTSGSICLQYDDVLFTGDHLLPDYTPNVGAGEIGLPGMLRNYLRSLDRVRQLPCAAALPGHGELIADPRSRVEVILQHHRAREERIWRALSASKSATIYQIALELFGTLAGYHVLLGCGEVYAHLDHLCAQGRVAPIDNVLWEVVA